MHILLTAHHTFLMELVRRICLSIKTLSLLIAFFILITQPRPQGLLLVQEGGQRNPWPRLRKSAESWSILPHDT